MPMRVDDENSDVLLLSLTGLESQNSEEHVMVQGSARRVRTSDAMPGWLGCGI